MIIYLNQVWRNIVEQAKGESRDVSRADIRSLVITGAGLRVRPMMMTVAAIVVGLLPIMLGHGAGSVVLRRIAGPMIGGLITTVFLTLLVIASYSCYGGVVASMAELLQPAVFQNTCRNNMG